MFKPSFRRNTKRCCVNVHVPASFIVYIVVVVVEVVEVVVVVVVVVEVTVAVAVAVVVSFISNIIQQWNSNRNYL